MMMRDIGVAVVGAGFIGPVHVEALRRLGLPVRGILGCDAAESQRAMKTLGLPKAYASLDEVLADAACSRSTWPCPTCCTTNSPSGPLPPANT